MQGLDDVHVLVAVAGLKNSGGIEGGGIINSGDPVLLTVYVSLAALKSMTIYLPSSSIFDITSLANTGKSATDESVSDPSASCIDIDTGSSLS